MTARIIRLADTRPPLPPEQVFEPAEQHPPAGPAIVLSIAVAVLLLFGASAGAAAWLVARALSWLAGV